MTCYHPVQCWYSAEKEPSGKRKILFSADGGFGLPFYLPCGRCIGCRLDRSRDWAVRLTHEAHYHEQKCFVTLTYAEPPPNNSLQPEDLRLFLMRLRSAMRGDGVGKWDPPHPHRLRFFGVGEYGEANGRPHYHVVLFGVDFREDRRVCGYSNKAGKRFNRYKSPRLDAIWGKGLADIGTLTVHSAGYVARYSVKKVYGDRAEAHYAGREPEFMRCSKGIGRLWWEHYGDHSMQRDFVVFGSKETPLPRFYDKLIVEKHGEEKLSEIKEQRKERSLDNWRNNTPERLEVREECKLAKVKSLVRSLK